MRRIFPCLLVGLLTVVAGTRLCAAPEPVTVLLPLDLYLKEGSDWDFANGKEFAGAKGALSVVANTPAPGEDALKLTADFTGGGKYVGMGKSLAALDARDLVAFHLRIKTPNAREIGFRVTDSSGQTHQKKGIPLQADNQWHDYTLPIASLVGIEHWGGANDGRWHGPGTGVFISLTERADPEGKKPELLFAHIGVDALTGDAPAVTYLQEDFESSANLPSAWEKEGDVSVVDNEKFQGTRSLRMARAKEKFDAPTSVQSAPFAVQPGRVEVGGAFRPDLDSPDVSFQAAVQLQCLDPTGKVVGTERIGEFSGHGNWTPVKKTVDIPAGSATARLRIVLEKATGQFWADDLRIGSAAVSTVKASPIKRILLKTKQPGNLLFPGDDLAFDATVESAVPLPSDHRTLRGVVRDYWGNELAAPFTVELTPGKRAAGVFTFETKINLGKQPFATGKYCELHIAADAGTGDPARAYSAFVYLPEAPTKKYPWRDVPFTARDWDNRIHDYLVLTDRLGIRLAGIRGGWAATPPYKSSAPGIDFCRQADMGAITGTPLSEIEHHAKGYEAYDETALREGIHRFFEANKKDADRLVFVLGNEPPSTGATVATNVALYKLMYEEIKKISPGTFVVGTSVGPAEEYFKLGFQNYCDAVDFHIYEDSGQINTVFDNYEKLFAKYGGRKPIWSTETGLNSQGLPRRAVAADLIRKFCLFFARGGQKIAWFDICYPDRNGKLTGGSDDSFNVFNGLYGLYHPRLDALAYYNMVNSIGVKKFAALQHYDDVSAYLFTDAEGHRLQVLWKNSGEQDVFVPMPGVESVRVTHLDGTIRALDAANQGLTLRVGEDPLLLLYDDAAASLPDHLGPPRASIAKVPARITRGESMTLDLDLPAGGVEAASLAVGIPPSWKADKPTATAGGKVRVVIQAPADTEARQVPVSFAWRDGDLSTVIPVQSQLAAQLTPVPPMQPGGDPAVDLTVSNNSDAPAHVQWKAALPQEVPVLAGRYSLEVTQPPGAYFSDTAQGQLDLDAHASAHVRLPLAHVDPLSVYKVTAAVTDPLGRVSTLERYVGGFVAVPKAAIPPKLDGNLDDPAWARCQPQRLAEERQVRHLTKDDVKWKGPADLSGELRFLWDDRFLYIAARVTDDVFRNESVDSALWRGDGLQLLIDPARGSSEKSGKYDYGTALTKKGPQAWCFTSGSANVPAGEAKDIVVAVKKLDDGTGAVNYEIAIPWARLKPFQPAPGANLGLAAALNEDDGAGRDGFMAWFGDIQSKEVSPVGDLLLSE